MTLSFLEIINGIFTLIFVSISFLVGIRIGSHYRHTKDINFLLVGLSWIGMASPWYPSTLSFIIILSTGTELDPVAYMMIGNVIIPVTVIIWFIAFTNLFYKSKQTLIVSIFTIISILYEILFMYFIITDSSIIGRVTGPVDVSYGLLVTSYQIFLLLIVIITGTLFALNSLKIEDPQIKLRGKLLIIAFYSFVIGAVLDIMSPTSIFILVVARITLISSAIEFYLAFVLPDWMKRTFLK